MPTNITTPGHGKFHMVAITPTDGVDVADAEAVEADRKQQWLQARRNYITATDVARLASLNQEEWDRVRAEKNGEPGFQGNKYTEFGLAREPHIIEWMQAEVDPSLQPNDMLCVSINRDWMAATPDAISPDGQVIAQVKTSTKPMAPADAPQRYIDQCLWERAVTGAETQYLAVEENRDLTEIVGTLCEETSPDDQRLAFLIETAERFRAGGPAVVQSEDEQLQQAVNAYGDAKDALKAAQEAEKNARKVLEGLIGSEPGKWSTDRFTVTRSKASTTHRIDSKALKADFPEVAEKCTVTAMSPGRLTYAAV